MKKLRNNTRLITTFFTLLISILLVEEVKAYSEDATSSYFKENGVYYTKISDSEAAVVVGYNPPQNGEPIGQFLYTQGDVIIPEYVRVISTLPDPYKNALRVVSIRADALRYVTSVELPKSIRYIGENAFAESTIKSITIPKFVSYIDLTAFKKCSQLEKIEVDPENYYYDSREDCNGLIRKSDNMLMYMCTNSSVIPNSVEIIADEVFKNRTDITSLKLPENLKRIGNYAFYGCTGLTELTMSDNLEYIGDYAFYGCTALTELKLPESLGSINNYAFYGCEGLNKLILPESLKSVGEYAFYGAKNIKNNVLISSEIESIGRYAFYGSSGIKNLLFTDNLKNIGYHAFNNCLDLESVAFVTERDDTMSYFETVIYSRDFDIDFNDCRKLKSIILSKFLSVQSGFLAGCYNLENFVVDSNEPIMVYKKECNAIIGYYIPFVWYNGVGIDNIKVMGDPCYRLIYGTEKTTIPKDESLTVIGINSFFGDMTKITIPGNIKIIEENAFVKCEKITDLYMYSVIPPDIDRRSNNPQKEGESSFYDPKQITVHVPKGALDNYIYLKRDWTKTFKAVVEWEPSGIEDIEVDEIGNAPAVYYNLQGVRVENPENGIFIKHQAGKTTKVVL